MGKLVAAAVLLVIAFSVLLAAATVRSQRPGPIANLLRLGGLGAAAVALLLAIGSGMVVIDPGEVGVRHAFGYVDPAPLLAGIRLVVPWSVIERYSTREEDGGAGRLRPRDEAPRRRRELPDRDGDGLLSP